MGIEYFIKYKTRNHYENQVSEAVWQFLVSPENNSQQECLQSDFRTSHIARIERSINGFGFETARVISKSPFNTIDFEAEFKVIKSELGLIPEDDKDIKDGYNQLNMDDFKIDHMFYLNPTVLTKIPESNDNLFQLDKSISVLENLKNLNTYIYNTFEFVPGITNVNSTLEQILKEKKGVCQDYSHLFLALARSNGIPCRYVSGYLHQGEGFFGDSQMHAWVEALVPNLGWIGFDATNNIFADVNHIKVAHGRDYKDCPPIKGILYSTGKNTTTYSVEVTQQQQQQQ